METENEVGNGREAGEFGIVEAKRGNFPGGRRC